jgi:hypothetical protein
VFLNLHFMVFLDLNHRPRASFIVRSIYFAAFDEKVVGKNYLKFKSYIYVRTQAS